MRRVKVDPNTVWRKRKHLVFALELRGRLTPRAQRLLIGAAIPLLFIEKHLNVNMFYLHSHCCSERNAFRAPNRKRVWGVVVVVGVYGETFG